MRRNGAKLACGSGDTDDDALATASTAGADADVLGELCCRSGGSVLAVITVWLVDVTSPALRVCLCASPTF